MLCVSCHLSNLIMKRSFRPYTVLPFVSLLCFILAIILPKQLFDIHIHNTFFVLTQGLIFLLLSITLLLLFTVYYFLNSILVNNFFSWFHIILTIVASSTFLFLAYNASFAYKPGFSNWESFEKNNALIIWNLLFILLSQLIFIIYIIRKTLQKNNNGS